VTNSAPDGLRIALVYHGRDGPLGQVQELATGLRDAGHRPCLLSSRRGRSRRYEEDGIPIIQSGRLPEAPLRLRGFAGPLTHVPLTLWALASGAYDVAHVFSPPDALAARLWQRVSGSPVVFTPAEPIQRERLADRRLRLALLRRAIDESDAVTATSGEGHDALRTWLAVDAPLIPPRDAAAHERLYRGLLDTTADRRGVL